MTVSPAQESDEDLFLRFKASRQAGDFELLVARYQGFAYRVALATCDDTALAEDAVQESFLQLLRAGTVFQARGPGSFRAWFFGLIRRTTWDRHKAERRVKMRTTTRRYQELAREAAKRDLGMETVGGKDRADGRVMDDVRIALSALEEELRLPLILHFLEGLPQAEVGHIVGVSKSQVSRRIERGLEALRRHLTAAGVSFSASALPVLLNGLPDFQVPAGLGKRVMEGISKALHASRRVVAIRPSTSSSKLVVAATVCALAAAGVTGWWQFQHEAPEVASPPTPTSQVTLPSTAAKRIHEIWTFTGETYASFEMFGEPWTWVPPQGDRPEGLLAGRMNTLSGIRIPLALPERRCWEVRIRGYLIPLKPGESMVLRAQWDVRRPAQDYTIYRGRTLYLRKGERIESVSYLFGDGSWEAVTIWNKDHSLRLGTSIVRYDQDIDRLPYLVVAATNCIMTEVELREIEIEAIPEPFGNLEHAVREFQLKPQRHSSRQIKEPEVGAPSADK